MSGNPGDLTTSMDVKAYLSITDSNSDTVLELLITAVSQWVVKFCEDPFLEATYTFQASGWGSDSMPLPYGPISAVSSVQVNDRMIPARASFSGDGFSWNAEDGLVRLTGSRFWRGENNIVITYTAGYEDVDALPADLRFAVTRLVALRFRERTRVGANSEGLGGRQNLSYTQDAAPADVMETLERYRRRSAG